MTCDFLNKGPATWEVFPLSPWHFSLQYALISPPACYIDTSVVHIYIICQYSMQAPIASIFLHASVTQHMYPMCLLLVSDLSYVLVTLAICRANTKNWPDRKPDINTSFISFALTLTPDLSHLLSFCNTIHGAVIRLLYLKSKQLGHVRTSYKMYGILM